MAKFRCFICNPYAEHCYLVWDDGGSAVVIDPGFLKEGEFSAFEDVVREEGLRLQAILLTHGHFDHVYGVAELIRRYDVPVFMAPADKVVLAGNGPFAIGRGMPAPDCDWPTRDISDGEILSFGDLRFEVITTPGHSPGSVGFLMRDEKILFSGDTLFMGTIGNTQLPWADYDSEIVSIMDKLMGLDGEVEVHPGHGRETTIAYERTRNPFLQPFNYKDPESGAVDGIEP